MSQQDKVKRYYWRHHTDFFSRHDIKLMESQPRFGHDAVLIYHKLMDEACVHDGELRYSKEVPYTIEDLKTITGNYRTFNQCFEYMLSRGLIEKWDDGTFYIEYAHKQSGKENGRTERMRNNEREHNSSEKGVKNAPSGCEKNTITTTTTKNINKNKDITTTTTEDGGSSYTDIFKVLSSDDVLNLSRTFDCVDDLLERVAQEVKEKRIIVEKPYQFIVGYANNVGWYKHE